MTLGAVQDDQLIAEMGRQIAEQCKRMGIQMNFAPVVDVNNNAKNPVIGMRSFGELPENVGRKGTAYALALQNNGILPTAKHFPGHGNTQSDSHLTLPVVESSLEELESNEFVPFQSLINSGVSGIMVAHLYLPALESTVNLSSSLSANVVEKLLKEKMGFRGLVVTDALDMKGATEFAKNKNIALMALKAGNDVLLLPENVPLAVESIKNAAAQDPRVASRIEESCKKILTYKYRVQLNHYRPVYVENLTQDLHKREYKQLVQTLYDRAITVLKNDNCIPINTDVSEKVAFLSVGVNENTFFQTQLLEKIPNAALFHLANKATEIEKKKLKNDLQNYDLVIVSIENTNILASKKFGIEKDHIAFVNDLLVTKDVVFNLFASPYALDFFHFTDKTKAILLGY